jgi:acyl dehydratase
MSSPELPERLELTCGPLTAVDLALFAAASGDHNPLHLDAEVARAAGFERPVVHGMLTMACVARLFTRTFGPGALRELQARFVGVAKCGDTLIASATLTMSDGPLAHYDVRARTNAGTDLLSGRACVERSTAMLQANAQ